ncbi:MAG TPA: C39 family peptidase [Candidatus Limnocylindria bacterium]|nr:C39 family peptidase [Candidatus Limnocylindria bacterium]
MTDMRRFGLSVAAVALTVGMVLAGGVALRPVETAQSAVIVDTAPIELSAAIVADSPAVVQMSAPTVPAPEQLPTPVAAPASAALPDMKHVWQSLNNCGPAAVVMALSTLGVDVNQEAARLALRGTDVRRGMGPQGVGPWVKENFDLRSVWRNNGTNEILKTLVANGFAPMVTQWMEEPWVSRVSHWRTVRGYDDAKKVFYVNDSMRGNNFALSYDFFNRNGQSFSFRYMVIYKPDDEKLLRAIIGDQWNDLIMRRSLYERTKADAVTQNTNFAWLAYGEASYSFGMFEEAVAAFEKGLAMGNSQGIFGLRNSYPQALRALGRQQDADRAAQTVAGVSTVPSSGAAAPPDPYAVYLAMLRVTPIERIPTE